MGCSSSKGTWSKKAYHITLPKTLTKVQPTPTPAATEAPAREDGDYTPDTGVSSDLKMLNITATSVKVVNGKIMVTIVTEPTSSQKQASYSKLYLGSAPVDEAATDRIVEGVDNGKKGYNFTFEVKEEQLGKTIEFVGCSSSKGTWSKKAYHITLPKTLTKVQPTPAPTETPAGREDGDYTINVESSYSMFKITSQSAKVVDGKIYVTLSTSKGTYDKIYLGSKNDKADYPNYIQGTANASGGYDFTFELDEALLGTTTDFVPGKPDGTWYSKNQYKLTFPADIEKAGEPTPAPTETPAAPMFEAKAVYVVKQADGSYEVTVLSDDANYDRMYVGELANAATAAMVMKKTSGGQGFYRLTVKPEQLVTGVYIPLVAGNARGQWFDFRKDVLSTNDPSEVPALPEDVPAGQFRVVSVSAAKEGDLLKVALVSDSADYDRVFIGLTGTYTKSPYYMRQTMADGKFCYVFTLPQSCLGTPVKFVPGKADGTWYTDEQLTFTCTEAALPETPAAAKPADGDYTAPSAVYVDRGDKGVQNNGTFEALYTEVTVSGDTLKVTVWNRSTGWNAIHLGKVSDENKTAIERVEDSGKYKDAYYRYDFTLPVSALGTVISFVPRDAKKGTWSASQYYLAISDQLTAVKTVEPEPSATPAPAPGTLTDGEYTMDVDSSASMFRVVACKLIAKNGKYSAVITLSGTGYDKLFLGTAEEAGKADASKHIPFVVDADGKYTYELPDVALDTPVSVAAHSLKNDKWYDRQLTFKSGTAVKTGGVQTGLDDGEYTMDVDSSASMFRVVACRLIARNGKYSAVITLSGSGYDKLFLGTAEEAGKADASRHIPFKADADGRYTYELPDVQLDTPVSVAAHSLKNDKWYDRQLTFKSGTAVKTGDVEPTVTPVPTPTPTPEPTQAPESDLSGSTSRVDSSTTLADGVYTPDKFSYSGGTGRTSISCTKVTVSGGKAKATIVFSSDKFSYVKANGQKLYGSHGGGTSTFEIPVKLNANNRIFGMTTAMTVDHEIEYTLYVYIAAAEGEKSAEEQAAPQVMGLKYVSTEVNDHAENFGIYHYEDGFTVIRVKNVADYLLAPEGAELPVGVDEDYMVVRVPVQSVYAASDSMLTLIGDEAMSGAMDKITLSAFDAQSCDVETLTLRLASGEVEVAGAAENPEYAVLLGQACDLAILPAAFADPRVLGTDETVPSGLDDEQAQALKDVTDRLSMLGIPAFVDLSGMEENDAGRLEWLKVYGLLLDCEDAANALYEQAAADLAVEEA